MAMTVLTCLPCTGNCMRLLLESLPCVRQTALVVRFNTLKGVHAPLPAGCHHDAYAASALEQQLPTPVAPGGAGAWGHV